MINLTSRHDPLTLQEVQYMLQSQEMRLEYLNPPVPVPGDIYTPSAQLATQMRRNLHLTNNISTFSRTLSRGSSRGCGRGSGGRGNRPHCQLCGRVRHIASKYYHIFDLIFQGLPNTKQ